MEDLRSKVSKVLSWDKLQSIPWFCAVSGGPDSIALLKLIRDLFPHKKCKVIFLNHHWSSHSNNWEKFVQQYACSLGLQFESFPAPNDLRKNNEGAAREFRLEVFSSLLQTPGVVLLGHHLDDQIETSLWRWCRGNWSDISPLKEVVPVEKGYLVRPLLNIEKKELEDFLSTRQVRFLVDPSNSDTQHTRNFLRKEVLPQITKHETFSKKALLKAHREASYMQNTFKILLKPYIHQPVLAWKDIDFINHESLFTLIKYWLSHFQLPLPSHTALNQYVSQCLLSPNDKIPELSLGAKSVLCYKGSLYLESTQFLKQRYPTFVESLIDDLQCFSVSFGATNYILERPLDKYAGAKVTLKRASKKQKIVLKNHTQPTKMTDLWKKFTILPWKRKSFALVYINDTLIQYGPICIQKDNEKEIFRCIENA